MISLTILKIPKRNNNFRVLQCYGFPLENKQASLLHQKRARFSELYAMKKCLGIDETPPALEISFKAATKLKSELLTYTEVESISPREHPSLARVIHVKTRKASQNTDLHMQEFLGIDKSLHSIHGELVNNTSKRQAALEYVVTQT